MPEKYPFASLAAAELGSAKVHSPIQGPKDPTSISVCLYAAEKDTINAANRLGKDDLFEIDSAISGLLQNSESDEEVLVVFKRTAAPFGILAQDLNEEAEKAAKKLRLAYLLRRCADRLERSL